MMFGAGCVLWCAVAAMVIQRYPPASWENKVLCWIEFLLPVIAMVFLLLLIFVGRKGKNLDPGAVLLELGRAQRWKCAWGLFFCCAPCPP
jgi:hypothetical protein